MGKNYVFNKYLVFNTIYEHFLLLKTDIRTFNDLMSNKFKKKKSLINLKKDFFIKTCGILKSEFKKKEMFI